MLDRPDRLRREEFGEQPHHHLAVLEHVRHPGRHPQVVLEHVVLALAGTNDVDAGDVRVDPARHVHALHLAPELRVAEDAVPRDNAGVEDRLIVIDVVQERVERLYALPQAAVEHLPFRRGNDPRNDVERNQPLGSAVLAVYGERDAHAMECAFRLLALLRDAARRRPLQPPGKCLVMRAHPPGSKLHFIVGVTGHESFLDGADQRAKARQVPGQGGIASFRQ